MDILVKILIFIAFSVLGLAIAHTLGCTIIASNQVQVLPAIAISTGVLIASLAYLRDKNKHEFESTLKHDEFQLKISKDGFDIRVLPTWRPDKGMATEDIADLNTDYAALPLMQAFLNPLL